MPNVGIHILTITVPNAAYIDIDALEGENWNFPPCTGPEHDGDIFIDPDGDVWECRLNRITGMWEWHLLNNGSLPTSIITPSDSGNAVNGSVLGEDITTDDHAIGDGSDPGDIVSDSKDAKDPNGAPCASPDSALSKGDVVCNTSQDGTTFAGD